MLEGFRNILDSYIVRTLVMAIVMTTGLVLYSGQIVFQWFSFGADGTGILNSRIYTIICLAIVVVGIVGTVKTSDWTDKLEMFVIFIGVIVIGVFAFGIWAQGQDALNDIGYTGEHLWLVLDAVGGVGVDWAIIVSTVPNIIAIVFLVFGILMLYYAEDAGQYAQAILELSLVGVFLFIFNKYVIV